MRSQTKQIVKQSFNLTNKRITNGLIPQFYSTRVLSDAITRDTDHELDSRKKVLVLGTGWGGFNFIKDIDKTKYKVNVISPTNHFLFTPLLPSSAVGTLEFRAIEEPVRTINGIDYFQGKAKSVDLKRKVVSYEDIFKAEKYDFQYDYLVLAVGSKTNTFNTPGVSEREGKEVFFLKHLYHARQIRNRTLECFERAAIQHQQRNYAERDRLLSFVVVGGGPTSCEFVGELHDFLTEDVSRWYPDLKDYIKVTLVEASPKLLGAFESSLASFVLDRFKSKNIDVRVGTSVKEFQDGRTTILSDGHKIPTGMMVWSAGLQQINLIQHGLQEFERGPTNRLIIDDHLRIPHDSADGHVFALGDCAVNSTAPLPPLAQSARVQGKWLADLFNKAPNQEIVDEYVAKSKKFQFFNLGSMASVGGWRGVLDFSHVGSPDNEIPLGKWSGFVGFLVWRCAYWGRQVSWTNKILIPMYWFKAFVFGRDISRF